MNRAGRLSIVSTPIGNLEDVTLRALRVLREADTILSEDTRRTRILCAKHGIATKLRAFHAHSPERAIGRIVEELLAGGWLALVTDAGTPIVSDPGAELVRAAVEAGVAVEAIPGPSAVTAAVTVSALPCDSFRFVGFLPRSGGRRARAIERIALSDEATVLFEAPSRVGATLGELAERVSPDRRAAVCRELTKLHEEVVRGTLAELAERFTSEVRGEITIVIEGESGERPAVEESPEAIDARIGTWLSKGLGVKDAARRLARETSMPQREAYKRVLAVAATRE